MSNRIAISAVVAASAIALAACSSAPSSSPPSSKSKAAKLLDAAVDAAEAAKSVKVTGAVTISSGTSGRVDLVGYHDGNFAGSIGLSGGTLDVVATKSTDYVRASAAVWQSEAKVSKLLAQHLAPNWVRIPSSTVSSFGISLRSVVSSLSSPGTTVLDIGHSTIDGKGVTGLKTSNGTTVWVTSSGKAYPVEASGDLDGAHGSVRFSGWNTLGPLTAPAHSLPLSSITG